MKRVKLVVAFFLLLAHSHNFSGELVTSFIVKYQQEINNYNSWLQLFYKNEANLRNKMANIFAERIQNTTSSIREKFTAIFKESTILTTYIHYLYAAVTLLMTSHIKAELVGNLNTFDQTLDTMIQGFYQKEHSEETIEMETNEVLETLETHLNEMIGTITMCGLLQGSYPMGK